MPISRGRKKSTKKTTPKVSGISIDTFSIRDEQHAQFKDALLSEARQNVNAFPDLIENLHEIFRKTSPECILATFGFYGARAAVDSDGSTRKLANDIEQHHIEFLQALVLTLPLEDWGRGPSHGGIMQLVFDMMPKVAQTFFQMRLLEKEDELDPQKKAISSLQERIRLHTQVVRNWGYYSEVIRLSRELYSPLDKKFAASLGFTATDLIDIAENLVAEVERRSGEHIESLRKILCGKTPTELVQLYFKHTPDLRGTPEEVMKIIPPGTTREGVVGWIISHMDLRHFTLMSFTADQVAKLAGKPLETAESILTALSLLPGELVGKDVRHLFLANPVWAKPGLKLGSGYLFAIPQSIFSHINEIMRGLAETARLETALADRRAAYLEGKMIETLQAALPTAHILPNAKWTLGDQQFETDAIVTVDRTLIIAEAKSHRITPQGLRGAPDRLKRHLVDLVVNPSIQSERLAKLTVAARAGDSDSQAIVCALGIDARNIDTIIRISVTLDDLSVLSAAEEDLTNAGWMPEGHSLAPSLHIADLVCIGEMLGNEIFFLHYFAERFHCQKQFDLLGDELDFLGLYLSTGFNLGSKRDDIRRMVISGMSEPIDRFYDGRDADLSVPKPTARLHRVYRDIVERLRERKPHGWTTIGLHLLNSASHEEQKEIERGLQRLRKSVTRKSKPQGHECFMAIIPRQDRKATVGFFVYPEAERSSRRAMMEQLASEALEREDAKVCVIFGKCAERLTAPYEAVLIAQHDDENLADCANG
jgi:hypothetical protein